MQNEVTDAKLDKYFDVSKRALDMAKPVIDRKNKHALDFFDMAERYYKDAMHFRKKGDKVTAFAALNYAHGWLDAGARIGFFDVHDSNLFTVD